MSLCDKLTPPTTARCARVQLYNERLSIAMRVAKAGAWNWDLVTKQTFWTPEFEMLFDYEPGSTEQVYSEWLDRVHPNDRDRVETTLQQAINGVLPEYRCDYRIVLRNGNIRWIDVIGELHSDEQGNHKSMSGLVYDVTDRKERQLLIQTQTADLQRLNNLLMLVQQQLQERNVELDRFVSIADDGPGIPISADRDRAFEIFQTLHPTTDSTENTGIGLALVKKIVEGEGGKIWLDDEWKQGCRFCFTWLKTAMPSQHRF